MTVAITIHRFKTVGTTMVGIGTDPEGHEVAFAPDRPTYIMAAPFLANGGPVRTDVEDWRIITTRGVAS